MEPAESTAGGLGFLLHVKHFDEVVNETGFITYVSVVDKICPVTQDVADLMRPVMEEYRVLPMDVWRLVLVAPETFLFLTVNSSDVLFQFFVGLGEAVVHAQDDACVVAFVAIVGAALQCVNIIHIVD